MLFWVGQAVSNTGDWLVVGALVVLIRALSTSSSAVSGLMIFKIVPALFLGSIVGVLVDRFNRKRAMIAIDVLRGLIVLTLPFVRSLWGIYAVTFVLESLSLFFIPAKNASIPNIVEEDEILAANSVSYTTDQISMIVGLSFGGVIVLVVQAIVARLHLTGIPGIDFFLPKLLGPHAVFLVDAFSFFASAVLLAFVVMRTPRRVRRRMDTAEMRHQLVEGIKYLLDNPAIRTMILTVGIAILGGGSLYSVGIAYTAEVLGAGSSGYIFVLAAFAIGMLVGAATAGILGRLVSRHDMFVGAIGVFALALLVFSTVANYTVALVSAAVAGAAVAALSVTGYTYLQETVTDELRGRVFTALESMLRISLLVSLAATGPIADLIGNRVASIGGMQVQLNGAQITLLMGAITALGATVFAYFKVSLPNGE